MKNILFTVAIILLISCSKNEEQATNPLKEKLVGKWKMVGYYDDTVNPETNTNYHPSENGLTTLYTSNGECIFEIQSISYIRNGNYTIAQDSIISYIFNDSNPNSDKKIELLNNHYLEIFSNGIGEGNGERYERVIAP